MKLTNSSLDPKIKAEAVLNEIGKQIVAFDKTKLDDKAKSLLSDATAIKANLVNIKTPEDYTKAVLRIASLVKLAFEVPDTLPNLSVSPKEFRKLPQEQLDKYNEDVTIRTVGEGKEYITEYKENFSNFAKKTKSMYDPLLMAERIMVRLQSRDYVSAQDGFEGFVQPAGPYGNASAYQKCCLGRLLSSYGFVIDYSKFEKEADADKQEYLRIHTLGKGDRTKSEDYKTAEKVEASKEVQAKEPITKLYCSNCQKSTDHSTGKSNKCAQCGRTKDIQVKNSTLNTYIRASYRFADDGMSMNPNQSPSQNPSQNNTDTQQRPDIVRLTIQKLKQMFTAFSGQKPTSLDINQALSQTVDQYMTDENQKEEEKSYLLDNPAVLNEISRSIGMSSTGTLREAIAKEAEEFISKKIKIVLDEDPSKSKEQAVAIAYSYAREKGYEIPKKD